MSTDSSSIVALNTSLDPGGHAQTVTRSMSCVVLGWLLAFGIWAPSPRMAPTSGASRMGQALLGTSGEGPCGLCVCQGGWSEAWALCGVSGGVVGASEPGQGDKGTHGHPDPRGRGPTQLIQPNRRFPLQVLGAVYPSGVSSFVSPVVSALGPSLLLPLVPGTYIRQ